MSPDPYFPLTPISPYFPQALWGVAGGIQSALDTARTEVSVDYHAIVNENAVPGGTDYLLDFDHAVQHYYGVDNPAGMQIVDSKNAQYMDKTYPVRGGFTLGGWESKSGMEYFGGSNWTIDDGFSDWAATLAPVTPHSLPVVAVHEGVEFSYSNQDGLQVTDMSSLNIEYKKGRNTGTFYSAATGQAGVYYAVGVSKGASIGAGITVSVPNLWNAISNPIQYLSGDLNPPPRLEPITSWNDVNPIKQLKEYFY